MLRANVAGAKVPRLGSCQEWNPGPKDYTTPIKTTDRGVMLLIKGITWRLVYKASS
jgi:hypothetical protein